MWRFCSLLSMFRPPVQQRGAGSWERRTCSILKMVGESHVLYHQKDAGDRPEGCSFLLLARVLIMQIGLNPCEWLLCLREPPPPAHTPLSRCLKNGSVIWGESSRQHWMCKMVSNIALLFGEGRLWWTLMTSLPSLSNFTLSLRRLHWSPQRSSLSPDNVSV